MLGTLKPVILLPIATINHLTSGQLEAILLHELAHIKRQDYLLNMLQTAGETILFFNPFVWLISRIIRRQREDCCDDLVVANTASPLQYAQALAILEQGRSNDQQLALAATGNRKHLLNRIKRIMVMKKDSPGYGQLSILLLSFITLAIIVAICTFTPSIAQRAKGDKSDTTKKKQVIENNQISIDSGRNKTPFQFESKPVESIKVFGSKEEKIMMDDSIADEQRYLEALKNPDTTTLYLVTKDSIIIKSDMFDNPLKINRIFKGIKSLAVPEQSDIENFRSELRSSIKNSYKSIHYPQLDALIEKAINNLVTPIKEWQVKEKGSWHMISDWRMSYLDSLNAVYSIVKDSSKGLIDMKVWWRSSYCFPTKFSIIKINGQLYLNGRKQSQEILDKFGKYYEEGKGIETIIKEND